MNKIQAVDTEYVFNLLLIKSLRYLRILDQISWIRYSLILESQDKIHMPIIFECLFEIYVPYNRICNKCCLHPLMMRVYIPLFLTRFLLIIFDPLFDNHVQWLLLWFVYCNAMGTNNEWVVFWLSHALLHFFHVLK